MRSGMRVCCQLFCMLLVVLLTSACDSEKGNRSESNVVSGTATINVGHGFDFSNAVVVRADGCRESEEAFLLQVGQMDFFVGGADSPVGPGPVASSEFRIIGSPVGWRDDGGELIVCGVDPDTSKPAVAALASADIDQVIEAPDVGYVPVIDALQSDDLVGSVFALRTQDSKYAIVEFTAVDEVDTLRVSFNWKYQPDGGRNFR